MSIAEPDTYLSELAGELRVHWPANRLVNIVCHGHSVPAGYFATPRVDTFNSYPHLLHRALNDRFPYAPINVIVTAIGGENAVNGEKRFGDQVLCHLPDVVTIDYSLNDRGSGLEAAGTAWRSMIEAALAKDAKVILLTPTLDRIQATSPDVEKAKMLRDHASQVRLLAEEYQIGLVDSAAAFDAYVEKGGHLTDLLSWSNHPNRAGHEIVAKHLLRYFPAG